MIELGPLELRPEAFLHSDSPVEIKAGYVGKLHIRLPNLHELTTGPFTVRVEGVYLLLGLAARHAEWDEEAEQRSKRARHQAEAAELAAKAVAAGGGGPSAPGVSFSSVEERAEAVDKCIESLMKCVGRA